MEGLKAAGIELDRKVLSDIAIQDNDAFVELVGISKEALKNKKAANNQEEEAVVA